MKLKFIATAVLCPFLVLFTGCSVHLPGTGGSTTNNPPPLTGIPATIDLATADVLATGLSFYASSHPDTANAIATQLQAIVGNSILPYLTGANGLAESVVDGVMKQNFVNLPSDIQALISTAAAILDAYIPVPGVAIIDATTLSYLRALMQGIDDGATAFLNGGAKKIHRGQTLKVARGGWLNLLPPAKPPVATTLTPTAPVTTTTTPPAPVVPTDKAVKK